MSTGVSPRTERVRMRLQCQRGRWLSRHWLTDLQLVEDNWSSGGWLTDLHADTCTNGASRPGAAMMETVHKGRGNLA